MTFVELRELQYFVTLARELHFGRAAERLYLDRSGLSKAIGRMELALGIELFSRGGGQLTLTPAGTVLLEGADEALQAFDRVRTIADATLSGTAGELTAAYCPDVRYELVSPIVSRFVRTCPDVLLSRREQLAEGIIADLSAGTLDVGIAVCVPKTPGLRCERLQDAELRVLVASSDRLASRQRIALEELREERVLVPPGDVLLGTAAGAQAILDDAGIEPVRVRDVVEYDEDLYAVRRGLGVLLSTRTFPAEPPAGIAVLGLDPPRTLPVQLVCRDAPPAPTLSRFLELARHTSAELGWLAEGS
jgi:DNA-binding transcriptional LysR family regulator